MTIASRLFLYLALPVALIGLTACDEMAVANDPDALMDLRGTKSCTRAVEAETGVEGAQPNTTLPVVEAQQYIIDVPEGASWTCYTDERGRALTLVKI